MDTLGAGASGAYARSFAGLCAGAVPFLMERALQLPPGSRVLDAGAGTGAVAAALVAAGLDVRGVDADAGMVDFASRHVPNATFSVDALPNLPFPDGAFDLVIANFVINHVAKPILAVRELLRVTAAEGSVLATIWPSSPLSPVNQLWTRVLDVSGAAPLGGHGLPAADDFTRDADGLSRVMSEAGATAIEVSEIVWDFTIDAESLWAAVEGGIATIGKTYRHQDADLRRAMRAAFEQATGLEELVFPSRALLARGRT